MKILIVGGTSSLGEALKPILSEFSELYTAGRKNCDYYLDLCSPIANFIIPPGIDVIIHTAASFGGLTPEKIIEAEEVNVVGTLKLCQKAVEAKVKHLVFISSIHADLSQESELYSIYSISKRHAEEVANYFCRKNSLPLTILRPSQIYGAGKQFRLHQPFFYSIVEKAANGEDILLYGRNDAKRNFIHIEDIAKIVAKVVQKNILGTFSCQHPENFSYSQLAKTAYEVFEKCGEVKFLKDKPDIPDNVFPFDNSLYKLINFSPKISLFEGIKKISEIQVNS